MNQTRHDADLGPRVAATVAVVMGSKSDWPTMSKAADVLDQFSVPFEARVVSAHRTPALLHSYGSEAAARGIKLIIAGAGGAAHLPGMLAALTHLPVLGVPISSRALNGVDSLLSIVQMPKGIPVATFAIGDAGAANAGLCAIAILALQDPRLNAALRAFRDQQTQEVLAHGDPRVDKDAC
jgi:5-(carboxyamino)imidazole ribonucleotide mutase